MLNKDEVLKILQTGRKGYQAATNEELETRLHTVGHSDSLFGYAARVFLSFVETVLPRPKIKLFEACFKLVVDTLELANDIIESFEDIFFAHDAVFTYTFANPENEKDWLSYREVENHDHFWKHTYYNARWHNHNAVIIVDKRDPKEGKNTPYYSIVESNRILALKQLGDTEKLEYFIFEYGEDLIAVYDDEAYSIYRKEGTNLVLEEQNLHQAGECPARYISPKSARSFYLRTSPISKYIGKFKYTLFWLVSMRQFDLYGPFPINWSFETRCDYRDDAGNLCRNGYVYSKETQAKIGSCPKCGTKQFNGPGTHVVVREPDQDGDMRQPAGEIPRDINALEYVSNKGETLKKELFASITGNLIEPTNNKAVNEKQVQSIFESRRKAMIKFASSVSEIRAWADDLACKMRYQDAYKGSFISYGTDFYLFSPADLMDMYKEARENKLDTVVLNDIQDRYVEVKFRGNQREKQRAIITYNIDPFRHKTDDEVLNMLDKGLITKEDAILKLNLASLIDRFERENAPIYEFGTALPLSTRVDAIKAKLIDYIGLEDEEPENISNNDLLNSYGIATRAGAVTPQRQDEEFFRKSLKLPDMSQDSESAWADDGGIRRPITLKSQTQLETELT